MTEAEALARVKLAAAAKRRADDRYRAALDAYRAAIAAAVSELAAAGHPSPYSAVAHALGVTRQTVREAVGRHRGTWRA